MFEELEKKAKEIEKEYGSVENFVVSTTIPDDKHKLKMRGNFQNLESVYAELKDLENADLFDFKRFLSEEDGKFG